MPTKTQEGSPEADGTHRSSANSEQSSGLSTRTQDHATKDLPASSCVTRSNDSKEDANHHLELGEVQAGGHPMSIPSNTLALTSPLTRHPTFKSHVLCQPGE